MLLPTVLQSALVPATTVFLPLGLPTPSTMRSTLGLPTRWAAILCLLAALSCLLQPSASVKEHDFKKCDQSGFCKRNRAYADNVNAHSSTWSSPYEVLPESAKFKDGQWQAVILKTINNGEKAALPITVSLLKSGVARISIDEEKRQKKEIELRHNSKARKERYNEAEDWVIVGGLELDKQAQVAFQDKSQVKIKYGGDGKLEVVIKFSPFEIEKEKAEGDDSKAEENAMTDGGEDESTWWDESFGGNTDSKPRESGECG
ncbi:glucosidase II [Metarhizium acridum]|nr:glucosidase II [Metarhizium acridum]